MGGGAGWGAAEPREQEREAQRQPAASSARQDGRGHEIGSGRKFHIS